MNIHTNFWIIHPAPNIVLTAPNGSEIIYRLNSIQSNLLTVAGVPQRHILGLNAVNTWNSFKFCRVWRGGGNALVHLCNPRNRTWRGHLVRDVEIKNKSPVSWSCFPPGSLPTVCLLLVHQPRKKGLQVVWIMWLKLTIRDVFNFWTVYLFRDQCFSQVLVGHPGEAGSSFDHIIHARGTFQWLGSSLTSNILLEDIYRLINFWRNNPPLPIHLSNTLHNAGRSISAAAPAPGTCNVTLH